ncbi:unnamed protein product [Phyllotreta striolata]|uniref:Translation initiation factor beta propellor-like domain-containing protein n=1 Tax=Phyllotreta striolata TaxID=444603 RepID=A0A9N9TN62_PHYSR|nr:unnamed protein product [Phyllotreta striolata]
MKKNHQEEKDDPETVRENRQVYIEMYVASVSSSINFHEFPTGDVLFNHRPRQSEGPIRTISWCKDGNWLSVVPDSGHTEIISVRGELKLLKTITEITQPSSACFQNTTKKYIGIGTEGGSVLVYDVKSQKVKKRFSSASSRVDHIAFTAKDTHCTVACKKDVLVYNNVTNSPPTRLEVPRSSYVTCLKTNMLKTSFVMAGSDEGILVLWDINTNSHVFCSEAHQAPVTSLAFSPVNRDLVLTAGADRHFCFYDIIDKKRVGQVTVENCVTAVDFSPDGVYFITACQNGRMVTYDSRNINKPVYSVQAHNSSIKQVAFQNAVTSRNASTYSISSSSSISSRRGSTGSRSNRNNTEPSDLSGWLALQPSVAQNEGTACSNDSKDSFLAALGVDKQLAGSIKVEGTPVVPKLVPKIVTSLVESADSPLALRKPFSSTPKVPASSRSEAFAEAPSTSEIKTIVRESFNEELRHVLRDYVNEGLGRLAGELKEAFEFENARSVFQLRATLTEIHVANLRDFFKMEERLKVLQDDVRFLQDQLQNMCPNL